MKQPEYVEGPKAENFERGMIAPFKVPPSSLSEAHRACLAMPCHAASCQMPDARKPQRECGFRTFLFNFKRGSFLDGPTHSRKSGFDWGGLIFYLRAM
jgi:hypothetical protein